MGEILRWRLLLFHVSRNTVSGREATWDESEQVLTYEGTELRLDQIPALLQSEYIECHRLLYDDLMLGDIRHLSRSSMVKNSTSAKSSSHGKPRARLPVIGPGGADSSASGKDFEWR